MLYCMISNKYRKKCKYLRKARLTLRVVNFCTQLKKGYTCSLYLKSPCHNFVVCICVIPPTCTRRLKFVSRLDEKWTKSSQDKT